MAYMYIYVSYNIKNQAHAKLPTTLNVIRGNAKCYKIKNKIKIKEMTRRRVGKMNDILLKNLCKIY